MKKSAQKEVAHSISTSITLSPRRESRMIDKTSSCNASGGANRRYSSEIPPSSTPRAVRVIHIFAPKVIKTDVANFRALVQKLTGRSKPGGGSGNKNLRAEALGDPESTTFSMRSSSDATFSSSTDMSTTDLSSTAAVETCSESSTRSSNSHNYALFTSPDCSTTSSAAAKVKVNRFSGLQSSSFGQLSRILPTKISAAAPNAYPSYATTSNNNDSSCEQSTSSSFLVDPLQSLSGYKDSWTSLQRRSSQDQTRCTASGQQQSQKQIQFHQGGHYHESMLNVTSSNSAFSELNILTGLVSRGPPPGTLPPPVFSNQNCSINSSIPTLIPEHFLVSNRYHQQPSGNCRQSVQSVLRGTLNTPEPF